jgi:hypothetical protein
MNTIPFTLRAENAALRALTLFLFLWGLAGYAGHIWLAYVSTSPTVIEGCPAKVLHGGARR